MFRLGMSSPIGFVVVSGYFVTDAYYPGGPMQLGKDIHRNTSYNIKETGRRINAIRHDYSTFRRQYRSDQYGTLASKLGLKNVNN